MATKKKATQTKPPALKIVPPGGFPSLSPEELLSARRRAAREAAEHIKQGHAQLREARGSFGKALALGREHRLPGVPICPIQGVDGRPDPEPWPGAKVLRYSEYCALFDSIDQERKEMNALTKELHKFLRETKGKPKP